MISVETDLIPIQKRFANKYNLQIVLNKLGNPEKKIPTISVVGTNGKGSTSFYVSLGLKNKYKKVGLFISPAFLYHNERIQINNVPISDEDLKLYLAKIQSLISKYYLTFFEIWTLIMIFYFADNQVDVAVVEAGIGGLKDATKVMSRQLLVLLTAISLDHTEVLGWTITEILEQKLGIAYPKTQILISDDNRQYETLIKKIANQKQLKCQFTNSCEDLVDYQKGNKGLAIACLTYLGIETSFDLGNSVWPLGRFTILQTKPKFILDGAHNLDGIQKLVTTLKKQKLDPIILYASSLQKDHQKALKLLAQSFSRVYATTFDHFKAWNLEKVDYQFKVGDWKKFLWENQTEDILICGSLYFLPQVYVWYLQTKQS